MGEHCSERDLVEKLKRLGFEGPVNGRKHKKMTRDGKAVMIPHGGAHLDIRARLLFNILRQAGVTKEEWRQG